MTNFGIHNEKPVIKLIKSAIGNNFNFFERMMIFLLNRVKGKKNFNFNFSFIAKLLPADDPARACVFEANLLEKEIELYFELLPSLRQFIRLTEMKRRKQLEIENESQERTPGVSSSTARYLLVY